MKSKKILLYLAIAVVVLVIFLGIGKRAGWIGQGNIVKISIEKPERRKIIETITANGKVQPQTEVKISPDVSGEIVELNVKEGDEVKQWDILLKIKPDIYQSNTERMEATLNSSKANLANVKARQTQIEAQFKQKELAYKRDKSLWEQKAISDAEYEQSLSLYQMAKADFDAAVQTVSSSVFTVKSSEASLKEANENLRKTTIYAPINGTVSKLNVEAGERVVGTAQMTGTELLRVANLYKMEVLVDVNENDIVRVKFGDTAVIEIDAYLTEKFKGTVTEIANSANTSGLTTDQVTNFQVKILILPESYQHLIPKDKPNYYPFRPGMSATVDIQTHTKSNVLSIPIQAITTREDSASLTMKNQEPAKDDKANIDDEETANKNEKNEKKEFNEMVFVHQDGIVIQKKVKTGIQDNNYIEIIEGLTGDEEVVIAPYSAIAKVLKDKQKVKKVDKDKLFEAKK